MKVTLTRNIGRDDIKRFGLDKYEVKDLTDGTTVDVSETSAKLLFEESLAEQVTVKAVPRDTEIKAPAKS